MTEEQVRKIVVEEVTAAVEIINAQLEGSNNEHKNWEADFNEHFSKRQSASEKNVKTMDKRQKVYHQEQKTRYESVTAQTDRHHSILERFLEQLILAVKK